MRWLKRRRRPKAVIARGMAEPLEPLHVEPLPSDLQPGQSPLSMNREGLLVHRLIATPFLDYYYVLMPGSDDGIRLPTGHFQELVTASEADAPTPLWLADAAHRQWGFRHFGESINSSVIVRRKSSLGFCRATWEINLGCNFNCEHCYLGDRPFEGMDRDQKLSMLDILRDAGAVWLQITGGEPLIDPDFAESYTHAFDLGMMIQVSTNASVLHKPKIIDLLTERLPYRVTVSMYGARPDSFDKLVSHKGAFAKFHKGVTAGIEAGLSMNLNLVVTRTNADDLEGMVVLAEGWGLPYTIYSNISPTFKGGNTTLLAQSMAHLAARRPFQGCNAGITFFHVDPYGKASTCKIARERAIPLMDEGLDGLSRLGPISDQLLQRGGGCTRLPGPGHLRNVHAAGSAVSRGQGPVGAVLPASRIRGGDSQ